MGDRVILCGSVKLSKGAFEKAQRRALLKLAFFVEETGDVDMRGVKPADLFSAEEGEFAAWAMNLYEAKTHLWVFGCSLHDDDWENAGHRALEKALIAAKDQAGTNVVLAVNQGEGQLHSAWLVEVGSCSRVEQLPAVPKAVAALIRRGKYSLAIEKMRPLIIEASTWTTHD